MEIKLTQGYVARVDAAEYAALSSVKWCVIEKGHRKFYAARKKEGRVVLMHRELMNAPVGLVVDHINGDTLDNRRENLRLLTHKENIRHRPFGANRNNPVGVRGVSWDKARKKFVAGIKVDGKRLTLGRFDSVDAAGAAYKAASVKFFGAVAGA